MRLKINLAGLLEDVQDLDAIPYLLKMYLREVLELDINIDPKNPRCAEFVSDTADISHRYNLSDTEFNFEFEYNIR